MSAGDDYEPGSLLATLDPEAASTLRGLGTRRHLRKGATLFVEGDASDRVFVLLRGRGKIFTTDREGREAVLAIRGAGDLLGELSAIDGLPRSASAGALEALDVLAIGGDAFRHALDTVPSLARHVLTGLVARLRDADRKRAEFGGADATRRVARRILELSARYGEEQADGTITVALPLSQEDLAAWTGASREAVSRAVGELRRAGLIDNGRRSVAVLDPTGLRRRSI